MMSKKVIRIIAALLAILLFGGVVVVALQVIASGADCSGYTAAAAVHAPGDTFSVAAVVIFIVALAVLISMGIFYIVKKRNK